MRWLILGISTLAALCLLGSPSASAWDGGNRQMSASPALVFSPHAPRAFVPNRFGRLAARPRGAHAAASLRLRRHGLAQGGLVPFILGAGGILTTEVEGPPIEQPAPAEPEVIIIGSRGAAPERAAPEPPPDYSYAGCRAIPSGYHCELPGDGTAQ